MESQCIGCLGGFYCPETGMSYPVDQCAAGYYCREYARTSTPEQGKDFHSVMLPLSVQAKNYTKVTKVMDTVALVLALMPLQNFSIDFHHKKQLQVFMSVTIQNIFSRF